MQYTIISSDSHINEPPDLFKTIPSGVRDIAPQLIRTDKGDAWVMAPGAEPRLVSTSAVAGRKKEEYLATPVTYETMRPGSFDPGERLKDMDLDHIDADVLYPGIMRYTERCANREARLACCRSYNEWIADFAKYDPARLVGIGVLPLLDDDDGDASIEALHHARSVGIPTAFLTQKDGGMTVHNPKAAKFWSTAAELDTPISLHIHTNPFIRGMAEEAKNLVGTKEMGISVVTLAMAEHLGELIFGGVFMNNPKLKVVLAEGGIGWIPYFLERMDHAFHVQRHFMGSPITELPSETFQQRCWATFQEDLSGVRLRDMTGVENLMWASDYPHTDTTWPESKQVIDNYFAGIPEEDKQKIVCTNAGKLYGLMN